ncbi:GNAT family N-acetyltransferase [Demequina aestuarii]|uniref:GNAT family N-acetyltransferase n=1 Tax=Demequina aestuarii TaxID=327095 RepID=UPI000781BB29|nr:GNAT family N-acetyltransferase [Demequina aestuarii]
MTVRVEAVTTEAHFADALEVRFAVFVHEQGVSADSERDALDDDPRTLHAVAYDAHGRPVGAGRVLAPHTDTEHGQGTSHGAMDPANPHIGRLAVMASARGTGAGRALMKFLEAAALERHGAHGGVRVELSAQDQAMPFYQRLGYTAYGDGYLDEGIEHHDAYKDLTA